MRSRARKGATTALAAVAVATYALDHAAFATPARHAGTRAVPSRLLVGAGEYYLTLSRRAIVRGTAVIQFANRGEDPHDLRLRRRPGRGRRAVRTVGVPETLSSGLAELEVRLAPGRYRLWCSLPGHRGKGMRASLRVTRR